MPHFFIILLKINLVLILFTAAYYLILRRLTFYEINRVFLAFGILFSSIYPFIDLTDFFHKQNNQLVAFVPKINQKVTELVPSDFITLHWQLLTIVFYIGIAFMAFRLIVQFISLYKMHKKSAPGYIANLEVRILEEAVSPFSFWQTIYINPALHKEHELQTILAHENVHVKEWHSLDIILAELSVVFYWFNPGVWLMKKAVKENLEFITDQKILNKGVDKKTYQYSLLNVGNLIPAVEIVNNFNLSDLKKRIKMMNVKRSSKLTLSRYMFVLPILLLITLAFTVSKKDIKKHFAPIKQAFISTNLIESAKEEVALIAKKSKAKQKPLKTLEIKTLPKTNYKYNFVINKIHSHTDSAKSIQPELSISKVLSSKVAENMEGLKGKIQGVMMVKVDSSSHQRDKIVENLRIVFRDDEKPTKAVGKPLNTTLVIRDYKTGTKLSDSTSEKMNNTTFYFNGNKITQEELNKINPNDIKSVNIQKGKPLSKVTIVGYGKINTP